MYSVSLSPVEFILFYISNFRTFKSSTLLLISNNNLLQVSAIRIVEHKNENLTYRRQAKTNKELFFYTLACTVMKKCKQHQHEHRMDYLQ